MWVWGRVSRGKPAGLVLLACQTVGIETRLKKGWRRGIVASF